MNSCFFSGRLTDDPVLNEYEQSKKCFFSVAIQNTTKDKSAMFLEFNAWDARADFCAQYLKKGMRVFVQGHMVSSSWTGKDGKKNNKFVCVVDRIEPIFPPKNAEPEGIPEMPSSKEIFDEPANPTAATSVTEVLGVDEEPVF